MLRLSLILTCLSILVSSSSHLKAQDLSIDSKIAEVYGAYTAEIPELQLDWINNCYNRCSVILESEVLGDATILNLSDIPLIDKYVATLSYDTEHDAATFNPLKYGINFHKNYDQYFRIGTSIQILKVEKKL